VVIVVSRWEQRVILLLRRRCHTTRDLAFLEWNHCLAALALRERLLLALLSRIPLEVTSGHRRLPLGATRYPLRRRCHTTRGDLAFLEWNHCLALALRERLLALSPRRTRRDWQI
jgi:hypothetical protein